jgi:hypothetical protein
MIRFRRGKSFSRGWKPGGRSVTRTAFATDPALKLDVLGRINPVDAAGKDGDRAARQCRFVSSAIDAARKS